MAIVPSIREIPLMEDSMDNKNWERLQYIEDRLQDPHISCDIRNLFRKRNQQACRKDKDCRDKMRKLRTA